MDNLTAAQKLERVILAWLREEFNVTKFGTPTWKRLIEAVNALRPALAKDMAPRHRKGIQ